MSKKFVFMQAWTVIETIATAACVSAQYLHLCVWSMVSLNTKESIDNVI